MGRESNDLCGESTVKVVVSYLAMFSRHNAGQGWMKSAYFVSFKYIANTRKSSQHRENVFSPRDYA